MVGVEIRFGQVVHAADQRDAGVVHQHIERAELLGDVLHHAGDGGAVGYVGADGDGAAAGGADRVRDVARLIRAVR